MSYMLAGKMLLLYREGPDAILCRTPGKYLGRKLYSIVLFHMPPGWCERPGFALQWRVVFERLIDGRVLCFSPVVLAEALAERVCSGRVTNP
jgi:hypothetical protein